MDNPYLSAPAGLRLTDKVLLDAAQEHVGGLEVLARTVLGRQQDPEGAQQDGVTPLVQLTLLGSEQDINAAVSCTARSYFHTDVVVERSVLVTLQAQCYAGNITVLSW
jgi:hypothetical protein